MSGADLVRMANQIAGFFAAYPRDEAVAGVADHLKKFWDPAMRRDLIELAAANPAALHDLVAGAIPELA
mgnify:CR=1 FL=1